MLLLDLTHVYGKVNTIKKNLFYGKDPTLKFYRTNTLVLELTNNWFMSTHSNSNLANGPVDYELSVADVDNILKGVMSDAVNMIVIKGVNYKIAQRASPKIESNVWRFRVEPIKGTLT